MKFRRAGAGNPGFGVGAEQARDVALNVGASDGAAVFGKQAIAFGEDGREGAAGVGPFVDDLLENAGIGMLRNKTGAEHFDSFARDLLDDGGIVHEPPATEREQVVKLARVNAELMLIFAAEDADKKTIVWKIAAKIFERYADWRGRRRRLRGECAD